jgi:hypothetical protein
LFNAVYDSSRKEDPRIFEERNKAREAYNLGRNLFSEGHTGKEKLDNMRRIVKNVDNEPYKGKL